jgi:hypothetical protein
MPEVRSSEGRESADQSVDERKPIDERNSVTQRDAAGLSVRLVFGGVAIATGALLCIGVLFKPQPASAVPSFATQTGQPCATCHTAFPELTPYGREFKLNGYTTGGGLPAVQAPPIAAMLQPTFTHTDKNQDAPPITNSYSNNNTILEDASLFYGGQIYGNLGALVQGTYDWAANRVYLDNSDVRYVDRGRLFGGDFVYGIDVNNTPTVQDVWNTTPAWSFPYITSTLAPAFLPPSTMIENTFPHQLAGAGVYVWWRNMIYAEVSAYRSLSVSTLQALDEPGAAGSTAIEGAAPYWRVAFAPTIGDHSFMIGTFGMFANEIPGRVYGFGTDQIFDLGFDAQYQYIHEKHAFEAKLSYISEYAQYNSSFAQGNVTNPSDNLNTFHATLDYVYDNTYSFTAGYFGVTGSNDAVLYANSFTGNPDSSGLIFDLSYLPFSHGSPGPFPWANARIGVSYTKYLTLFGASTNFDGPVALGGGGHNASDNNTLLAYTWIMF